MHGYSMNRLTSGQKPGSTQQLFPASGDLHYTVFSQGSGDVLSRRYHIHHGILGAGAARSGTGACGSVWICVPLGGPVIIDIFYFDFIFEVSSSHFVMLFTCIALITLTPVLATDIQPLLYKLGPLPELEGPLEQNDELEKAERFKLNELVGPVSFAFHRDHIFTGLANGQIVDVSDCGIKLVASLGPPRCNGELQCGRPTGLRMDRQGRLIVADAHRGIFRINVETGDVETLYSSSTPVGGRRSKFISDVVVAEDGTILFTDSSARWPRQEMFSILLEGESTGRLLAYSDTSNKAIVVLDNLSFPNGLQLGPNDEYLLIAETGRAKILKLSLNRNDGTWRLLTDFATNLPGLPDNIRASGKGTYWVAFSQARHANMTSMVDEYAEQLQMRKIIAKVYSKAQIKSMTTKYGIVVELDDKGNILRSFQDPTGLKIDSVSEAHEHEGYLHLGSSDKPFISRVVTTKQFNVDRFLGKLKSTCRATQINLDRLRIVLRRLIAIAELRRTLLAAQRRREENARQSSTTAAPSSDSTASSLSTTTANVPGVSESSTTSLPLSTQAATATSAESSDGTTSNSEATSAETTSTASVTTAAQETTTVDEETGGGLVDPTTEAPTTATQTSASTGSATDEAISSATDSTTQAAMDTSTATATAATTGGATTASGAEESTAGDTTAATTASQSTDGVTTASATDASTDSSATTMSTAATT
ncbi:hypothetical protein RRG08_021206 [Elysia crispata]|uniref:Strictosidine synthase conserved region domain-containing protein n=1 Tax=Elysia crispata TaxID=231223 RepID=A0AAE1D2W7_9GAST|nr:hypothetical protein RRG08_021206 [Elysia crispata]